MFDDYNELDLIQDGSLGAVTITTDAQSLEDGKIIAGYGKCKSCECRGFEASFWGGGLKCKCGHHQSQHR